MRGWQLTDTAGNELEAGDVVENIMDPPYSLDHAERFFLCERGADGQLELRDSNNNLHTEGPHIQRVDDALNIVSDAYKMAEESGLTPGWVARTRFEKKVR